MKGASASEQRLADAIQGDSNMVGRLFFLIGSLLIIPLSVAAQTATPPPVPSNLTVPSITNNPRPTISWHPVAFERQVLYDIDIGTAPGLDDILDQEGLTGTSFTLSTPLADGTYFVHITAIDSEDPDNESDESTPVKMVIDTTKPAAPIINDAPTKAPIHDLSVTVTGTAEAGNIVTLSLIDQSYEAVTNEAGIWSITIDAPLDPGRITIIISARDAAGNISNETSRTIEIVPTEPLSTVIPQSKSQPKPQPKAQAILPVRTAAISIAERPEIQVSHAPVAVATTATVITTTTLVLAANSAAATLPILDLFWRTGLLIYFVKRREKWGRVIDADTRQPIIRAQVQVFDAESKRLLESQMTDDQGYFAIQVQPGRYTVKAQKAGYADYYGQTLSFSHSAALKIQIPLTLHTKHTTWRILILNQIRRALNNVQILLIVIGFLLEIVLVIAFARPLDFVLLFFYIALGVWQLYQWRRPLSSGRVIDQQKTPIQWSLVRALSLPRSVIAATRVTDQEGKLLLALDPGDYRIVAMKEGYISNSKEIKIARKQVVKVEIELTSSKKQ